MPSHIACGIICRPIEHLEPPPTDMCAIPRELTTMKVSELGEFDLIERLRRQLPKPHAGVIVGIGDDAAVLRQAADRYLLATCDAQVEGRHFLRGKATPYQIGRKALAVNLSDIA